jgi:Protein of unknown function (DUF2848)
VKVWLPGDETEIEPRRLVVAGYTGRDRAVVERHIEELREEGIARPRRVPMFWEVPVTLLTAAPAITVRGPETSGEVEPLLIVEADNWYVGVGSDHTARNLERFDILDSKRACPKVMAPAVWRHGDVCERWDELEIRSRYADERGRLTLYQEGRLDAMLPLPEILAALEAALGIAAEPGLVVFLGTLPLLTGGFAYGPAFDMEMFDPTLGRSLRWRYDIAVRR